MERLLKILTPYFLTEVSKIYDDIEETVKDMEDDEKENARKESFEEISKHIENEWKNNRTVQNKTCDRLEKMTNQSCHVLDIILRKALDSLAEGEIINKNIKTPEISSFVIDVFVSMSMFFNQKFNKMEWNCNIIPDSIKSVSYYSIPWDRVFENNKYCDDGMISNKNMEFTVQTVGSKWDQVEKPGYKIKMFDAASIQGGATNSIQRGETSSIQENAETKVINLGKSNASLKNESSSAQSTTSSGETETDTSEASKRRASINKSVSRKSTVSSSL